ncbi:MAG: tetratricopeptide repeat protein [Deltaproteobacteria bacterium]|nr:tetratricopeptide repeat protein [Deltaproteobacteria bacterium]
MKKNNMTLTNITKPNDAWIIHRQEVDTTQDGNCNVYFLLDAHSGYLFGIESSVEQPDGEKVLAFFKKARETSGQWPKTVMIFKGDPFIDIFQDVCDELNLSLASDVTKKELKPYVKNLVDAFGAFKKGEPRLNDVPLSEEEEEEIEQFIPETYSPCPCASGDKFKFCCQKIFKDITLAMCAAEEGHLEEAINHMQQAEAKARRTAEVVCRIAICWSFFDKQKTKEFIAEAKKINPNHPRLNYIMGIDAKSEGKCKQAISYYLKAIENYPAGDVFHLNETYNNLGTVYYETKEYTKAKQAWEKALVLLPSDKLTRDNLMGCIYENPDMPDAVRIMSPFMEKYVSRK